MHVLLAPAGSHGDVHPFIGLGQSLRDRGHSVTLITTEPFRELADRHGFDFAQAGTTDDYHTMIHHPDMWHPWRSLDVVFDRQRFPRLMRESFGHIVNRYQPGETVVVGGTLAVSTRLAHEAVGIPCATVHLQPISLTSVTDPALYPTLRIRSWWPHWSRRMLLWFGERIILDRKIAGVVNELRGELGLRPITRVWGPWRHSPQLVVALFPEWFGTARDWPPQTRHTGFVRYDQSGSVELPSGLRAFLDDGPPPVVFTFGSAMRSGQPLFAAGVEACERLGLRGLLLAKGTDQIPSSLPDSMLHVEYAPFSAVFPRAAGVVHHGGIGTTAQALAAALPQVVVPLAFDQPDNAERLERLGVSVTVPRWSVSGSRMTEALEAVLGSALVADACRSASNQLLASDSVDETCGLIEGLCGTDCHPSMVNTSAMR